MSDDLIKRVDAIEAIEEVDWYHQNKNKDIVSGANSAEHQAWYKADDVYKALEAVPSADRPQGTCLKEAEILLKATRNLLNKQNESIYVLNMLAETVTYHGVECDGSCLIEDIDAWMELYGSEEGADNVK